MDLRTAYRATGADWPGGDLLAAHGVAMEGYFWRFTDVARGRVLIALIGVNQGPDGAWATLGLAASNGFLRTSAVRGAVADPNAVGARAGTAFFGDATHLEVDLGEDARVQLQFDATVPWPHRVLGGSSVFQAVPGLNQYWHPWLLGGRARGTARIGGDVWELDGAQIYAEKNWGKEGFPDAWWWGQAQGFRAGDACVAFAGGEVTAGPLATTVTGLVLRLPDRRVLRLGNPGTSPVEAIIGEDRWELRGRSARWQVHVIGRAPTAAAHVLPVPLPSEERNVPGALEHLTGGLSVHVRENGGVVWDDESKLAGLEFGSLQRASGELQRRGGDPRPTLLPDLGCGPLA